jgi:GxxExxY protein
MPQIKEKVLYPELSYAICGICFDIQNKLGRFRSEKSYADALEEELRIKKIGFKREMPLPPSFEGEASRRNIPDFIIDEKIILDCKAKRIITREDYYQMQRYLSAYAKELGLLINFQQHYLSPKRILAARPNSDH